ELVRLRLPSGEDAAVRVRADLVLGEPAATGHVTDELIVDVDQQRLQQRAIRVGHLAEGAADVLAPAGGDGVHLDAGPAHHALEVGELEDDADGTGEGARVGGDLIGGRGDVVAT